MGELYEVAVETNLMLAPANSPRELIESRQLAFRGFFTKLGSFAHFPRSFVHTTSPDNVVAEPGPTRPAPERGENRPAPWDETTAPTFSASARRDAPGAAASSSAVASWTGTNVLEFGTGAAGPIAVRYFAEHGATVIRLESRSRPDFLRIYGMTPSNPCGLDGSEMFDSLNVGKLGVTLNLKHPEGVALAKRLVVWADAVAENFAPRAMRSFGLDYASLVTEKPDLVMVSSCLQGQTGPHKDYPGFGGQGSALGGYNLLTGWPDREPVGPYGTITDSLAPRFVASALAAGLLYRRRTGRGVHLDVAQVEAAAYTLSPWILDFDANGHIGHASGQPLGPRRATRGVPVHRHRSFRCHRVSRRRSLEAAGGRDGTRRLRHHAPVDVRGPGRGGGRGGRSRCRLHHDAPRDAVADMLQAAGIEAVPVADMGDASADPQLHHRGHFVSIAHPCMGRVRLRAQRLPFL